MTTFGKKLHSLMKDNKITQQELAEKLNVRRGSVSNWVTDRRMPDSDTIVDLANIFNVTTDYLLGNDKNIKGDINSKDITFDNAQDALKFILKQPNIMAFDVPELTDEEIIEFANDILDYIEFISSKHNKHKK